MCLTSLIDRCRMSSPLTVRSHPLLTLQSHWFMRCQQIVVKTTQIDHSVKAIAEFCMANRIKTHNNKTVRSDNHKTVRFGSNINNDDDDDDECGGNNSVGVGTCCIGFDCPRVEVLESSVNETSTQLRATTNDNDDNNNDTTTRQHDEPLHHHHPQTLTRPEKALPGGDSTELPKHSVPCYRPQTEDSSSSSCSASTCRRSCIPLPSATGNCGTCRMTRIPSPAVTGNCDQIGLFIPDHQRVIFPVIQTELTSICT